MNGNMNNSDYGIKLAGLNYYVFHRKTNKIIRRFSNIHKALGYKFKLSRKGHQGVGSQ